MTHSTSTDTDIWKNIECAVIINFFTIVLLDNFEKKLFHG